MGAERERRPLRAAAGRRPSRSTPGPRGGRAARGRLPLRRPRRAGSIRPRLPGPDRGLAGRRADLRRGLAARGAGPRGGALRHPPGPARRGPARHRALALEEGPGGARGCPSPGAASRCTPAGARRAAGADRPAGEDGGSRSQLADAHGRPGGLGRLARPAPARSRAAAGAPSLAARGCCSSGVAEVPCRGEDRRRRRGSRLLALRARRRAARRRGRPRGSRAGPGAIQHCSPTSRGPSSRLALVTKARWRSGRASPPTPPPRRSGAWSARPSPSTPAASP